MIGKLKSKIIHKIMPGVGEVYICNTADDFEKAKKRLIPRLVNRNNKKLADHIPGVSLPK
jgi:hypothetical protein